MQQLLRIDSSSRLAGSHSRTLGNYFGKLWSAQNPDGKIITRDVITAPIGHIEQTTIEGFYAPADQQSGQLKDALMLSDTLIEELQRSDTLLLTVPIYNFSVPSALKAWIDQVVRIGHTFSFDGENFAGLVKTKNAVVICAYGANGYLKGEPFNTANYLEPYLEFLLGFLGIEQVDFVSLQSTTADEATIAENEASARLQIEKLLTN